LIRFISNLLCRSFQAGASSALTSVLGNARADEPESLPFGKEHGGSDFPSLSRSRPRLRLAGLVCARRPVAAMLFHVSGFDVAAEVAAIDSTVFALAAQRPTLSSSAIASRNLCSQHEGAFVGHVRSREGQCTLALHLVQKMAMAAR